MEFITQAIKDRKQYVLVYTKKKQYEDQRLTVRIGFTLPSTNTNIIILCKSSLKRMKPNLRSLKCD